MTRDVRRAILILAVWLAPVAVMGQARPAERPLEGSPPVIPRLTGQAPQSKQPAAAATPGFSAPRLARIDSLLQQYVDDNRLAGAVALVLRDGKPVYERAVGWSDKEAGRRMTTDTIFRIASQTKALTSASIMALVEEGKIGINDPVSRFIPAYAKTTVSVRKEDGTTEVVAARRPSPSRIC